MVNLSFAVSDEAEGREALARLVPKAAAEIEGVTLEAGSVFVVDDELDAKTKVQVRVSVLPGGG